MTEFHRDASRDKFRMLDCLIPRVRQIAASKNCTLSYEFAPAIQHRFNSKDIDVDYIVKLADEDDYRGITNYVKDLCNYVLDII